MKTSTVNVPSFKTNKHDKFEKEFLQFSLRLKTNFKDSIYERNLTVNVLLSESIRGDEHDAKEKKEKGNETIHFRREGGERAGDTAKRSAGDERDPRLINLFDWLTLGSSGSSLLTFWKRTLPIWTWRFCCNNCANCGFCDRIAGFCCNSWATAGFCTKIWLRGVLAIAWSDWCCCCCCWFDSCCWCCCCCCCKFGELAFEVWQDWDRLLGGGLCRGGLWGVCGGVGGLPGAIDDASFSSFTFTFPVTKICIIWLA